MIIYDFDETIYDGDSSVDFYKYCFNRKPFSALKSLLVTIFYLPHYFFKIISFGELKEKLFKFVIKFNDLEAMVEDFWDENENKIKKWYLDQHHENDVVISASFDFIIKPICHRLNIKHVIGTKYNLKNGKIIDSNCSGKEKILRFEEKFPNKKMKQAYSDSKKDLPILEHAKEGFVVIKDKIIPYEEGVFEKIKHNNVIKTNYLILLINLVLIIFTILFNNFLNLLLSFTLSYIISTVLLYVFNLTNNKINLKFILSNILTYLLLLCFVYMFGIIFSFTTLKTIVLVIIIYIPSLYLMMKY